MIHIPKQEFPIASYMLVDAHYFWKKAAIILNIKRLVTCSASLFSPVLRVPTDTVHGF